MSSSESLEIDAEDAQSARASMSRGRPALAQTKGARSLLPREHGAYGQLGMPLATGLLLAGPSLCGGLFAVAAVAAFVAHEPALVLLGQRGTRATREDGRRAWAWLLACGLLAALGLGGALLAAPEAARLAFILPGVLGLAAGGFVVKGAEKTTAGELCAAAAMSSVVVPMVSAAGASTNVALATWLVWLASFSSATLAVRAVIARARKQALAFPTWLACAALLATTGAALVYGLDLPRALWSLLPGAAAAMTLSVVTIAPKHLRRVGWTLLSSSVATLALMVTLLP